MMDISPIKGVHYLNSSIKVRLSIGTNADDAEGLAILPHSLMRLQ